MAKDRKKWLVLAKERRRRRRRRRSNELSGSIKCRNSVSEKLLVFEE
jgi:hypothetical protein